MDAQIKEDVDLTAVNEGSRGWRLLTTWDFGLLWWGQLTSQVGERVSKVALLWYVYTATGSGLMMTMVGVFQSIPFLILGPLVGIYLDRLPKKHVMIWVDLTRMSLILVIPVLNGFELLTLPWLYMVIFLISIVSTVFNPALVSAVPLLVNRGELVAANSLIQGTYTFGLIVGPMIGGMGITLVGEEKLLYFNAATFLVSALCLMFIRLKDKPRETVLSEHASTQLDSVHPKLLAGFRFVWSQSPVRALVAVSLLYEIGVSAFFFIVPVYSKEFLQVGPVQLGYLWTFLGIGMLIASFTLMSACQVDNSSRFRIIARAMTVGGLAVCSLSLLETPLFAAVLMIVVGGSTAVFKPLVWGQLQEVTPAHLMGRVVTTFSMVSMLAAMAGMTSFGWMADAMGPALGLIAIGLILLFTALIATRCSRRVETWGIAAA